MPDPPSNEKGPSKSALPSRRPEGEKPRAFADHTTDPADGPGGDFPLKSPPPEALANRTKASLPTQRKKERALPTFTPAPYQAESPDAHRPGRRADLPERRKPDEHPKFRAPHPEPEAEPDQPPALGTATPAPGDLVLASSPPPAPARPAKHRLADNRVLEMKQQGTVEVDPELTEAWGGGLQESRAVNPRSHRLILGTALISLPLIALAIWHSLGRPGSSSPSTPPPAPVPTGSAVNPAEETRRASEFVKDFLATSTLEERAAMVRHPEVTKPRMEKWHSPANPLKPRTVLDFQDRSAEQTIDGVTFIMLTMVLDDHIQRSIAVEKTADGGYLVDWESFVSWSDPRWPEFLSQEPEGAHDFRVVVRIDSYFNYGYADAKKWFCYNLSDPENWATCWGYCPIDSEAGMQINRLIRRQRQQGENQIKAILKLRFEDAGKGRNQVLIEEVVEDGWLKLGP